MAIITEHLQLRLDPQGRLVIPAEIRRGLTLQPGQKLIARIEDGRLVMEKRDNILRRLRARFAKIPPELKLSDELLADRRREAAREVLDEPTR